MIAGDKLFPWDKILSNQNFNSDKFIGEPEDLNRSIYETVMDVCNLEYPADEFSLEQTPKFTIEEMASSKLSLHALEFLIKLTGAKRVLEIGTFIGISAMTFAKALPADGRVVTIEKFDHFAEIAIKNFAANGFAEKIELLQGDAIKVLGGLSEVDPFYFIFIDGNKENYTDYLKLAEPLLAAKGLIIIDDAFFHGDVLNEKQLTDKGAGVRGVLNHVQKSDKFHKMLLPISNGILVLGKI